LTGGCAGALCNISDIAVAPTNGDVAYVVTSSDGITGPNARVTKNARVLAPVFSNITPLGVAKRPLTSVTVSPLDEKKVVITASGFAVKGGHVFLSTDLGAQWTDISVGLPDIPALTATFDPSSPANGIYVGTDIGVFHTANNGGSWTNANLGM